MVAAPPNFRGDLKISDQNNWEGPEQKIKFWGGELNLRGDLKFYGGSMNIVGKGGHFFLDQTPSPLSKIRPPILKSKMSPPFIGLSGNNSTE